MTHIAGEGAADQAATAGLLLLLGAGRTLAGAVDELSPALQELTDLCVPTFTDLARVELVGDGGAVEVAACTVRDGSGLQVDDSWPPLGAAFTDLSGAALDPHPPNVPDHTGQASGPLADLRRSIGASSVIVAPVLTGGVVLGWVCCANGPGRPPLQPRALLVVDEIARQIGSTVQRVRLYQERIAAAGARAQATRRLHRLAAAAANLAGGATTAEVLHLACVEACLVADADAAAVRWEAGGEVLGEASVGDAAGILPALGRHLAEGSREADGWSLWPLPCSDAEHRALLAVAGPLPDGVDALLESYACLVPVAVERALLTDASIRDHQRLQAILDASPVALVTALADGSITEANGAATTLFGWGDGRAKAAFPPAVLPLMRKLAADAAAGERFASVEVAAEGLDLSVSGARLYPDGAGPQAVLAIADHSGQRLAQRALLRAQRIEAMGQVAGGLAHDFNNLLTVMLAATSVLHGVGGERERIAVEAIEQAATRASELTRRLLTFTRSGASHEEAACDAGAIVRDLKPIVGRVVGPQVLFDACVPTEPLPAAAEEAEVEQLVLNLAINAADAMQGHGSLHLRLADVELIGADAAARAVGPGRYVRLEVHDDGPGMDEATLNRCLDPFFSTKPPGEGSGLGLSTVYAVVSERRGHLAIDSSPGGGTSVVIHLPATEAPAPEPAPPPARPSLELPAGTVVLVAEADGNLRALATMALTGAGAAVVAARSGKEAIRLSDEIEGVDVLVTSALLVDMSGLEVAARLRAQRPSLPVIVMTSYALRDPARGPVPQVRVLRKPYTPTDLVAAVAAALSATPQGS